MKLSEAIKALEDGKKIRETGWDPHDYIYLDSSQTTYSQLGSPFSPVFQLCDRWEIYQEPKRKIKLWPALMRKNGHNSPASMTGALFADDEKAKHYCGEKYVRLLTEYPAIEIEVDANE